MELILASSSRYRQQLLRQVGIDCRSVAPDLNEAALTAAWRQAGVAPMDICQRLATAKANKVAALFPADLVLGSDQLLTIDGDLLGKPGTEAAAIAQLQRLSGREHQLLTAFTLQGPSRTHTEVVVSTMTVRTLTDVEIRAYIAADQPLDCAGSYKWESRGVALFERVQSPDPSAIVGLPLIRVITALRNFGFNVLSPASTYRIEK